MYDINSATKFSKFLFVVQDPLILIIYTKLMTMYMFTDFQPKKQQSEYSADMEVYIFYSSTVFVYRKIIMLWGIKELWQQFNSMENFFPNFLSRLPIVTVYKSQPSRFWNWKKPWDYVQKWQYMYMVRFQYELYTSVWLKAFLAKTLLFN